MADSENYNDDNAGIEGGDWDSLNADLTLQDDGAATPSMDYLLGYAD